MERYLVYVFDNCQVTFRRCDFERYYTMDIGGQSTCQIEDCVFQGAEHDFLKPQDTPPGAHITGCTFAQSSVLGTDGIDTAGDNQLLIDGCLFYDIPDKAVSIEASTMTVRNCLIYNCDSGVAVKDDSTVVLNHNTIANSSYGVEVYLKNAGAQFATAYATNNIFWGNGTDVSRKNPDDGSTSSKATIQIAYSDVGGNSGTAGTGNLNKDPLFRRPGDGDFRLASGSPAAGAGLSGDDMGAPFPVGAGRPLRILRQPLSQTAAAGSDVTLDVKVLGNTPLDYQWQFNGADIPGGTASSLVIPNAQADSVGVYQVRITGRDGSTESVPVHVMLDSPVRLVRQGRAACGGSLQLVGPAGGMFVLQSSTNLIDWTPVLTKMAPAGVVDCDPPLDPNEPIQFYRALFQP